MDLKTKFNLKDKVWYMKDNKPVGVFISSIEIFYANTSQDKTRYNARDCRDPNGGSWLAHPSLLEDMLYSSKAELLESL